ncbi:hypothetical protein OQA88_7198 [Cercophora sp. LCS_1]
MSDGRLRILEFVSFPRVQYATISYVWRGNCPAKDQADEFSVAGAEDADPISVHVLLDACKAALACGAPYLWLDRLCIMQICKQDKQWQIREMYRVYTFAAVCIVIPGGLRSLVPFGEETQWIHRSWTLQEVVAPPITAVLFAWTHGAGGCLLRIQGEDEKGRIDVVRPGVSAMTDLDTVLVSCSVGYFDFTPDNASEQEATMPIRIQALLFGAPVPSDLPPGAALADPLIRLPNAAALVFARATDEDAEIRDYCIWQCALVRTSSRPVDMVYSIMGILGVELDPSKFAADDRLGATIALAREILRQGRSASWLGLGLNLPPCPYVSTFPIFPETSVAGKAFYNIPGSGKKLLTLADALYPNHIGVFSPLTGSMDEAGYFSFNAPAVRVTPISLATSADAEWFYDMD